MGAPLVDGEFGPTPETLEELVPIQIPLKRDDVPMSELKFVTMGELRLAMGLKYIIPLVLSHLVSFQILMV